MAQPLRFCRARLLSLSGTVVNLGGVIYFMSDEPGATCLHVVRNTSQILVIEEAPLLASRYLTDDLERRLRLAGGGA